MASSRSIIGFAMLATLGACSKAPSCKEAVEKARSATEVTLDDARTLIGACEQQEWSADARQCVASARSLEALYKCGAKVNAGAGEKASTQEPAKPHKRSEAALLLDKLATGAKAVFVRTGSFPTSNGALLPAAGPAGHCCGSVGGTKKSPGTEVVNKCTADPEAFQADPGWSALSFTIDEPTMYQYQYAGGAKEFTAYAIGDLDCDGTAATWTLHGTASVTGEVQMDLTPPPKGIF